MSTVNKYGKRYGRVIATGGPVGMGPKQVFFYVLIK